MITKLEALRARQRRARELKALHEVNARVNHNASLRVAAGMTAVKTMHHGADLCGVIAKSRALQMQHGFHQERFLFGRTELGAVLIVTMPPEGDDIVMPYVLAEEDDFVWRLCEYELKILETSDKLGLWEEVDEQAG